MYIKIVKMKNFKEHVFSHYKKLETKYADYVDEDKDK